MHKIILFFLLSGIILVTHLPVLADTAFDATVERAKVDAENKKREAFTQAQHFDPNSVFNHYTTNPAETHYYQGITQTDTHAMANDVLQTKHSEMGEIIASSIRERPQFVVTPKDASMQHAQFLQNEADNIVHGVTNQYIDCKPKQACTTTYEKKQCEEAPQAIFQACKKQLLIDVIPHETVTHYPLVAHLSVKEHNYAGVSINAVTGRIDFLGPHDTTFRLEGRLPDTIDCHTLQGTITSKSGNAKLDHINFPSCSNGLALDFHLSSGHELDLHIDMLSTVVTSETKDRWVDECAGGIASDTTCQLTAQQCTIPSSTKILQGIPVTRDCWEQTANYLCRGGSGDGTCKPLQAEGCEQVDSACVQQGPHNQCIRYRQTYRCPLHSCSPTTDVVCGNGKEYCLDGNCTDHHYTPSTDFTKSVSALSAVMDAAKQLDSGSMRMFTGHPAECNEKPVGYSNCCTETGWGQDIGLDHCPDAAKKLHTDREKNLAIKVGRYCSGPDPFPCIEHTQVFCVFSSTLAKIIQAQGRAGQLKIDFGHAKEPNCQGITPEQLQAMDLSAIDFQEFITDLNKNIKNPDTNDIQRVQNLIRQHIDQDQADKPHA